jgi:hypothetical protein
MRRALAALVLGTLVVLLGNAASGGGVRDLADAWLLDGPRTALLLSEPGAATRAGRWWLEARQGALYGLPELPQMGLVVRGGRGRQRLEVGWERLGSDLYREDMVSALLLHGQAWRVGLQVDVAQLSLAGDAPRRSIMVAACLRQPLGHGAELAVDWPLTGLPPWYGDHGLGRWIAVHADGTATAWTLALHRRGDGSPAWQVEALVKLAPGVAWGGRWDAASGSVGLCTAWRRASLVLRSSHLVHDDLGLTHRWSLGVTR